MPASNTVRVNCIVLNFSQHTLLGKLVIFPEFSSAHLIFLICGTNKKQRQVLSVEYTTYGYPERCGSSWLVVQLYIPLRTLVLHSELFMLKSSIRSIEYGKRMFIEYRRACPSFVFIYYRVWCGANKSPIN